MILKGFHSFESMRPAAVKGLAFVPNRGALEALSERSAEGVIDLCC